MFNRTAFKQVCEGSGFTKKELALIYGVSRQTIYDWLGEAAPAQLMLVTRAETATKALTTAMTMKMIPFPVSTGPESRKKRIDSIIKTVLSTMIRT